MLESYRRVSNPLTIIAIFAGITEVGGTVVLPFLSEHNQAFYLWFLIIFPCILVSLFFITLNFNNKVLYAPSDFEDENNFVDLMSRQFKAMEFKLEKTVAKEVADNVSSIERNLSNNELLIRAKSYFKSELYDEALEEVNSSLELKETGAAYYIKAMIYSRKLKYDQAIELCTKGLEFDNSASVTASLHWSRACYKSLSQYMPQSIIDDLQEAILYNMDLTESLESDDDLEYLRRSPEYNKFIENIDGPNNLER
jgi:tetratricopeptide (TPR) repeat protein